MLCCLHHQNPIHGLSIIPAPDEDVSELKVESEGVMGFSMSFVCSRVDLLELADVPVDEAPILLTAKDRAELVKEA